MTEIGCYVERALDRFTVTTRMLCCDSALKLLVEKARFGGSSFLLLLRYDCYAESVDASVESDDGYGGCQE